MSWTRGAYGSRTGANLWGRLIAPIGAALLVLTETSRPQEVDPFANESRSRCDPVFVENCGQWASHTLFISQHGPLRAQFAESAVLVSVPWEQGYAAVRLSF